MHSFDTVTTSDLRAQFPHTEHLVYLDHAATGPLSRPVMDAVQAFLEQRHRTRPNNYVDVMPTLERGRTRLARLLGCAAERVEYAPNTSTGLNVLALGLDWQPGDRVAVPACEFPANVQPWLGLRERYGVEVDFIPAERGGFTLGAVEQALTPRTRVLAVSWVQFLSGFRCDLAALSELAHSQGVLLAVDAIQGLGALQLDVVQTGVDFLASGGQKWMLGMQGSAFIYVTEALQERLTPIRGWLNGPADWNDFGAFSEVLHPDATRFRIGTLPTVNALALDAALGLYFDCGAAWVEERVHGHAARFAEGFDRLGLRRFGSVDPARASGIVTVEVPDPEGLHAFLAERRIHVSVRDRKLRFAPHAYNSAAEVDQALAAVADGLTARVAV
ncbi:MAG: aminotransferase class V-fold PLP-dependent enzyme [Rhodothermaceae bacterium]|nr:aminotransferase class V-fold PLP-dependent enzyme [Rhodothermaceae bacterium]